MNDKNPPKQGDLVKRGWKGAIPQIAIACVALAAWLYAIYIILSGEFEANANGIAAFALLTLFALMYCVIARQKMQEVYVVTEVKPHKSFFSVDGPLPDIAIITVFIGDIVWCANNDGRGNLVIALLAMLFFVTHSIKYRQGMAGGKGWITLNILTAAASVLVTLKTGCLQSAYANLMSANALVLADICVVLTCGAMVCVDICAIHESVKGSDREDWRKRRELEELEEKREAGQSK